MDMTKAAMIRKVAREGGFGYPNNEIAEEVKKRYGAIIGPNQIIEVLGPQKVRQQKCLNHKGQIELATRFLKVAGTKGQAVRLLNLIDAESGGRTPLDARGGKE